MSFTVIIPARMKSTRLPEKPLKDICGKPMIVRVAEAASRTGASRIAVATDHEAIYEACRTAGIECVMTRADHPTGTDRLAEAASLLGLAADEIVVNIQGDEPLMPAEAVNQTAALLADRPECAVATAAHTLTSIEDFFSPNVVKVELDNRGNALTLLTRPYSWPRDAFRKDQTKLPEGFRPLHHLGLLRLPSRLSKRNSRHLHRHRSKKLKVLNSCAHSGTEKNCRSRPSSGTPAGCRYRGRSRARASLFLLPANDALHF